jgi:hypothetical protein
VANLFTQFLTKATCGNAFEKLCQICWAVFGWSGHEKVRVIRHHLTGKKFETVLDSDLVEQLSQAICYRSGQNATAVLGTPDQVVIQIVHCPLGALHVHILIIVQMFYLDNFLGRKRRKAASSPDSMSGVSAAEML